MRQAPAAPEQRSGRRRRRWPRVLAILMVFFLLLPALAAVLLLRTSQGRQLLAEAAERAVGLTTDYRLELTALEGDLPQRLDLGGLRLADPGGPLLEAADLQLAWHPLSLLEGRLEIEILSAARLSLRRLPEDDGAERDVLPRPEDLRLPLALRIGRLSVEELLLSEELLGEPARLKVTGAMTAEDSGVLAAELKASRLDGPTAELDLHLRYDPSTTELSTRLAVAEPAGGLLTSLLDLPGTPPLSAVLQGDGPLSDWRGELTAAAGANLALTLDLVVAKGWPLRLAAEGRAEITPLLPAELQPLARPDLDLAFALERESSGALSLTSARLESGALRAALSGRLGPEGEEIAAELSAEAKAPALLAGLLGAEGLEGLALKAAVEGRIAVPLVKVEIEVAQLAYEQAEADHLRLALALEGEEGSDRLLTVQATAEGLAFEGLELPRWRKAPLTLSAHLVTDGAFARLTLTEAALDAPGLALEAAGALDLLHPDGSLLVEIGEADLSLLQDVADLPLQGQLSGQQSLELHRHWSLTGELRGHLRDPALGIAEVDALLVPEMEITAALARDPSGALTLRELELTGDGRRLAGSLFFDGDFETFGADWQLSLADLSPLSAPLGVTLSGPARAEGTASGALANPRVEAEIASPAFTLAGVPLREVAGSLTLADTARRLSGTLKATAGSPYGPLDLAGDFRLAKTALEISDARLSSGDETQVSTESLTIPLSGEPLAGRLALEASELSRWSRLVELPVSGAARGTLAFSGREGVQQLAFDLQGRSLGLGETRVQRLSASGSIADLFATPHLDARASLREVTSGPAELQEVMLSYRGGVSEGQVRARAEGDLRGPLELSAEARILRRGSEMRVTLETLEGRLSGEQLALTTPAELLIAPSRYLLSGLSLRSDLGNVTGGLTYAPKELALELSVSDVEMTSLRRLLPQLPLSGEARATARLSGTPAEPRGGFTVELSGLRALEPGLQSLPPMQAQIQGEVRTGSLSLEGRASGFAERPLEMNLRLPFKLSVEPPRLELPRDEPLEGSLRWSGRVGEIMAFLPVDSLSLGGKGVIDLTLSGTLADPSLFGRIGIAEGRYENYTSATLLRPLDMMIEAMGDRLVLRKVEAGDGNGGRIRAEGVILLGDIANPEADLKAHFERATIARRDDIELTVSGDLAFKGDLQSALASGDLTVNGAEVQILDKLPPSVVTLNVVEKDALEAAAGPNPGAPWLALNLAVALPGRVFVRGRGLDSEWEGQFYLRGTASDPMIEGELRPVRGEFSFAGKTFILREGSIIFEGGEEIDPQLDLAAVYKGSGFDATVRIQGSASSPEIVLSSQPELPRDEILSRILFNKTTAKLSAAEGVQLAEAAAALTGKEGPGIVDLARRTLGVDVLRFGTDERGTATVTVGEYLTDQVFVGVEQGAAADSTGVTVEVEITPNVTVESEVGTNQSGKVGVRWQWDY